MKTILILLRYLIILLLIFDLYYWLAIYGSGHLIPPRTERSLAIIALTLVFLLLGISFYNRKLKK
jgi:hypothetical protein